MYGIGFVHA